MTDDELDAVVGELGREPTDLELAMYSVMWSEHCSYKSSRAHLGRFPTDGAVGARRPGEGAGVVDIGDGLAVAVRIESHNHPSAVEPYQGAATGVGGIIRDIFSMGARPIALMDPLRFGTLDDARTRYLFEGVVSGISGYGNSVGVPTVGGEVVFDDTYRDNPLVNVLCLGILPTERLVLARAEGPGNLAVLLGSSTGRDGIGGASVLASAGFEEGSEAKRPSVQVGDPFEEKRLIEACLELLDRRLAVGVQDLGAAGLSCAASETAAKGGVGMDVDVARVAKREPGHEPGRGADVGEPGAHARDRRARATSTRCSSSRDGGRVRATVVGRVTDTGRFRVFDGLFDAIGVPGENPPPPLGDDAAACQLRSRADRRRARRAVSATVRCTTGRSRARPRRTSCRPTIPRRSCAPSSARAPTSAASCSRCSRRRRSPTRRGCRASTTTSCSCNTVAGPGGDAAVLAREGHDARRSRSRPTARRASAALDPRTGGRLVVLEAARNVATTGARPLALVNCLNFGNPEHPEVMWQFAEVVEGISEACEALGIPVIGGNVSLLQRVARRRHPPDAGRRRARSHRRARRTRRPARRLRGGRRRSSCSATTRPELGGSEWAAVVHG